jgi:HEAT repeat protein
MSLNQLSLNGAEMAQRLQVATPIHPTHPQPLQGGEPNVGPPHTVPLPGGARGGFVGDLRAVRDVRLVVVSWGVAVGLLILAFPGSSFAQEARLVNAKTQTRAITSGLEKEFRSLVKEQTEPAWVGYAVSAVEGNHRICCSSSEDRHKPDSLRRGSCKLEGRDEGMNFHTNNDDDEREGPTHILVLYRVEDRSVGKIRVFTDDCELDAGGLTVHWLTEVKPKESIDLLATFVEDTDEKTKAGRKKCESAIAAIALHAEPAADRALEKFVDAKRPEEVRKNTAFWLGNLRGQKGYEVLRRLVREDPSDKVREHCTFALHVSKVPEAVNAMIDAARKDRSTHVRGQALFWLSQKAGEKAAKAISDAIENDPETDVKKKAVFALSQLPKDEGIPKLIRTARVNRNKEVRKDAMFWLGQSNDPRALAFFEEVLTK